MSSVLQKYQYFLLYVTISTVMLAIRDICVGKIVAEHIWTLDIHEITALVTGLIKVWLMQKNK